MGTRFSIINFMDALNVGSKGGFFSKRGQSLIELAVFGSLFIVLFSALVSYGVKYNYNQGIKQRAFRAALASASGRVSSTSVLVEHNPMPDPSDTFGLGSSTMVAGSATVTKNYQYIPPRRIGAAPITNIKISGDGGSSQTISLYNAGIRREYAGTTVDDGFGGNITSIDSNTMSRYRVVYGSAFDCGEIDPDKYPEDYGPGYVKIIDQCAGHLLDYGACKEMGRLATETAFCTERCTEDELVTDITTCAAVCSAAMLTPPWYANLEGLFQAANPGGVLEATSLGLKYDMTQTTSSSSSITKAGSSQTNPTGGGSWSDTLEQTLAYQASDVVGTGGSGSLATQDVTTTAGGFAGIPSEE